MGEAVQPVDGAQLADFAYYLSHFLAAFRR
jgi:hypothetical protein